MKAIKKKIVRSLKFTNEQGSALIIVTLLLALLTIYVSASLTLSSTDAIASNFEVNQQIAFYAAYSKLEQMSSDFSTLFQTSPSPTYDSMCKVVISDPATLNSYNLLLPNVDCPNGGNCQPG